MVMNQRLREGEALQEEGREMGGTDIRSSSRKRGQMPELRTRTRDFWFLVCQDEADAKGIGLRFPEEVLPYAEGREQAAQDDGSGVPGAGVHTHSNRQGKMRWLGTSRDLTLRFGQLLLGAASLATMRSEKLYDRYTTFNYFCGIMVMQLFWSSFMTLWNIYALTTGNTLQDKIFVTAVLAIDWVTFYALLSAVAASGSTITAFMDRHVCLMSNFLNCITFEVAALLGFADCLLVLCTASAMFFQMASLRH